MSTQQHQLEQQIANYLATLLPGGRPHRICYMTGPESSKKYIQIPKHQAFTHAQLLEHASTRGTWATTLDADGAALAGAFDVDEGGQPPLWAALAAASELGVTAYAIAVDDTANGGHNGGHFWCIFDRPYPTAHIIGLMHQIADRAQLTIKEFWPSGQVIRLPFGLHRRANTRGDLLLQSGEIVTLDRDLAAGFAAVAALPRNSAPPAIAEPAPVLNLPKSPRQLAPAGRPGRATLADVRARFNAEHTIEQLLLEYGAQRAPGGYSCPCGVPHTHQVTLYISSKGRLFSFSNRCKWYTDKGWDAFGLYVLVEHSNDPIAAAKELNPIASRQARQEAPTPAPEPPPGRTPAQIADAQRKRAQRAAAAAETLADVRARAAADETLRPTERAVLEALLTVAGDRGWCRPSKERIAALAGCGLGSVKRALFGPEAGGRLEGRYFVSEGDGGGPNKTAIRTFLRGSFGPQMIPMLDHESDSYHPLGASERAPSPQPASATAHMFFLAPPAAAADRGLLGYVRALAKEAAEPGWALRDYAELGQAQLEQEAARLEQLLQAPAADVDEAPAELEPAAQPGAAAAAGASYSPPSRPPTGQYTGRVKDLAGFETLWHWSNAAIQMRPDGSDHADDAGVEQQLLDEAPSSAGRPHRQGRGSEISALDRYRADVALMSETRLAGELKKHQRTLKKHAGAAWLASVRDRLELVQAEIDRRDQPAGLGPSSSLSQAPPASTSWDRPRPIGRAGVGAARASQAQQALQLGFG